MDTIDVILTPSADGTLHLPLPANLRRGPVHVVATLAAQEAESIPEHAIVRLCHDLDADGLKAGEIGTVVHVYEGAAAYEVEFIHGRTRPKLVTVEPADIERAEKS